MAQVTVLVSVKTEFTGDKIREVVKAAENLGMEIFLPVLVRCGYFLGNIDAQNAEQLKNVDGIENVETEEQYIKSLRQ